MRIYRRILAAIDPFEDAAQAVLDAAETMAAAQPSHLTVASAYSDPSAVYPYVGMAAMDVPIDPGTAALPGAGLDEAEAVEERERHVRKLLEEKGLDADVRVPVGEPGDVVPALAEEIGADLIIVGSHHRRFLDALFTGSVSRRIARHAPCDVLLVAVGKG